MYLRTMGANTMEEMMFSSTCLAEEDVRPLFIFFFLKLFFGNVFLWRLKCLFMTSLLVEVMVDDMVSLGG